MREAIQHLAFDATGFEVYDEGEWKVKKTRGLVSRVSRKLHIAVYTNTHKTIAVELSLSTVKDR